MQGLISKTTDLIEKSIHLSKIIVKSIHFQIKNYLNQKKLIYMYQSGFKTNHSTNLCLAQLIDFVATGMDAYRYDISRFSERV